MTFNAYAEESITGMTNKTKAMLLRPGGWISEWKGASKGVSEKRGDDIVVKINTAAWNINCERNVTITSDAIKFDGCSDKNVSLYFDPNDKDYPFKGESPNVNYKPKAK